MCALRKYRIRAVPTNIQFRDSSESSDSSSESETTSSSVDSDDVKNGDSKNAESQRKCRRQKARAPARYIDVGSVRYIREPKKEYLRRNNYVRSPRHYIHRTSDEDPKRRGNYSGNNHGSRSTFSIVEEDLTRDFEGLKNVSGNNYVGGMTSSEGTFPHINSSSPSEHSLTAGLEGRSCYYEWPRDVLRNMSSSQTRESILTRNKILDAATIKPKHIDRLKSAGEHIVEMGTGHVPSRTANCGFASPAQSPSYTGADKRAVGLDELRHHFPAWSQESSPSISDDQGAEGQAPTSCCSIQ